MSDALSREDILDADDLQRKEVDIPEWGGTAYIRQLRGDEFEEVVNDVLGGNPEIEDFSEAEHFQAELLVRCLCDEDGERILEPDDVEVLAQKSVAVLNRLSEVVNEVNGFEEDLAGN